MVASFLSSFTKGFCVLTPGLVLAATENGVGERSGAPVLRELAVLLGERSVPFWSSWENTEPVGGAEPSLPAWE